MTWIAERASLHRPWTVESTTGKDMVHTLPKGENIMADEEVTQAEPAETPVTQVSKKAAPDAVAAFMDWLNSRNQQAGPFGMFWGPEHGQALVKEFCEKQGW